MNWAQGIAHPAARRLDIVADVNPIFKVHLVLGMTIFLVFPFTRLVHVWSAPVWYLGRARLSDRALRPQTGARHANPAGGVSAMSCASAAMGVRPRSNVVRVNGAVIPREAIAREAQHHPAATPAAAFAQAARALAIRQLLPDEARRLELTPHPLDDGEGRRETDEEALVRQVVDREIRLPRTDDAACRRYFEQNRKRFRSPDIFEAAHILFAAAPGDRAARAKARGDAVAAIEVLRGEPGRFSELAHDLSACPSARHGGNLGQITRGATTPEFDHAMSALAPGATSRRRSRRATAFTSFGCNGASRAPTCPTRPFATKFPLISPRPSSDAPSPNMSPSSPAAPKFPGIILAPLDRRSCNRREPMLLGDLLRDLQDETLAMEALAALNDLVLLTRVRVAAERRGETPGEYAANSTRAFADRAGDEDWMALVTALENSREPGQTCLARMIKWALQRDAATQTHSGCGFESHADRRAT